MIKKSLLVAIYVLLSVSSQAQETFLTYKTRFADKQAILLTRKEEVRMTLDKNDSLSITLNYTSDMLHLGDRTEGLAESSVSYSDFVELSGLEAKTMVPNKSSYKTLKVTDFKVKTPSSAGIFYDDNKLKVFNYPGVQPGAKTVLTYSQKFKEYRLLHPFYFNSYVPVISSELVIYVDKRIKLGYRLLNNGDGKIEFKESVEGNFRVYRWKGNDLPEFQLEGNAPPLSSHQPHVIYFIEELNIPGKSEVVFKETKDLYRWYYGLSIKSQQPVGNELKAIIDSLTQGVTSPYEKARRIFYWVQDHVSYVAFEEGYGGFIPRDANLVCNRRYGDCKDMANLLVQMLNVAGVEAYHTWIGTRDIPYSYEQVPSTNVDNHMITAVKLDGNYYFLDATGKYFPLGLPTGMIQGKEALVGIDKDRFEIVKVPVIDASKNTTVDSTYCKVENNVLRGNGKIYLSGYRKIDASYRINYTNSEEQKNYFRDLCTKGSNKFLLVNHTMENLSDKEKPIVVKYEYQLEDYVKSSANELYINLNLNRALDKERIDTLKRKLPIEYEYKNVREDVVVFEIPSGYAVDYLPENITGKNDFFEFEIRYKKEGAKIIYTKRIIMNTLLLERKGFGEWNKINNKLSQAYREVVVLKQK